MSLSNAQRARLGIFMIVGVTLLLIFAAIPIGYKLTNKQKIYFCNFSTERTLSGLEEGADIKFRGVRIGKVGKISYDRTDLSHIKAELKIQEDFPMKNDMFVETGMMGITGLKYIEVLGGTDTAGLLEEFGEIKAQPSMMSAITGKMEDIVAKVELLLNHLNVITNPDSLAAIKKILDNTADITNDVKVLVSDIRPKFTDIALSAKGTVQKLDTIVANVSDITGKFNQSIEQERLASILKQVDSTAIAMKNLSENLDLTIRQTREDFSVSVKNLKETMENANELSQLLAENPSLILRSDPKKERSF